jgi:hypothetical protein
VVKERRQKKGKGSQRKEENKVGGKNGKLTLSE